LGEFFGEVLAAGGAIDEEAAEAWGEAGVLFVEKGLGAVCRGISPGLSGWLVRRTVGGVRILQVHGERNGEHTASHGVGTGGCTRGGEGALGVEGEGIGNRE
jgi:hypothetical protein